MAAKKKTLSIKKPTLDKTMSFAKGNKPSKSGLVPVPLSIPCSNLLLVS